LCLLVLSFALYFWWMGSHPWILFTRFFFMQESSKTLVSIVGSWLEVTHIRRLTLHEESRPMFNSNQAFLFIHAKVEVSPKGFYIRSQGWNRKNLFNLPPS
jgi:hypothetical protein